MTVAYVSAQDGKLYAYGINGNSVDISSFAFTINTKGFDKAS